MRSPYPEISWDIEVQDKIFSQVTGDERTVAEALRKKNIYKEEITINVGELLETI